MFLLLAPLAQAGLNPSADYVFTGMPAQSLLGAYAATGDSNGDGLADFAVTASGAGKVALFSGQAGADPDHWTYWSYTPDFGWSLAYVGDLNQDGMDEYVAASDGVLLMMRSNGDAVWLTAEAESATGADVDGDGYDDLIIGEPYEGSWGQVRVLFGQADLTSLSTGETLTGTGAAGFGYTVCALGDVQGDGFEDVAVSQLGTGEVHLYSGSSSGLSLTQSLSGGDGFSLACAGDIDGDGKDDLALRDSANKLRVHLSDGVDFDAGTQLVGYDVSSLGRAGDITADGYDDLLIGSGGDVYLFEGSASGLETSPDTILVDPVGGKFGFVVLGLDDVNGDAYGDVLISSPQYGNDNGWVGIWYGQPDPEDTGLEELDDPGDGAIDWEEPLGGGCATGAAPASLLLGLVGLLCARRRR